MNIYLLMILLPSIIVVLSMKLFFADTIDWREAMVQFAVPVILMVIVFGVSRSSMMSSTEILNGEVTGKARKWTSCEHDYRCRCHRVRKSDGGTREECDTCYRHSNDWDWRVSTTVGDFDVSRVDSRGSIQPPRWTVVERGQPMARVHPYTNYVKAAPESLFGASHAATFNGPLPDYPKIHDYQYANRVLDMNANVANIREWNDTLARSLNRMGPVKQVNYIVVMTNADAAFAEALRKKWFGGEKNDVIVVIGTHYPRIEWVRVFSWAKSDMVNIALRDALLESKTLDSQRTIGIISSNIMEHYERRPMREFEYLAGEIVPPTWVLVLSMLLGLLVSITLGRYFIRNDPFKSR